MCITCGCSEDGQATLSNEKGEHTHILPDGSVLHHTHEHEHEHHHEHNATSAEATPTLSSETPPPSPSQQPHHHEHTHHEHTHHEHTHSHHHEHTHVHHASPHASASPQSQPLELHLLERRVLDKNDRIAERNRGWFAGRRVLALNLMSSPGAGKTCLLERTLREISGPTAVIEGDQETTMDAERIRATGAPAIQVNTGKGCHLEAEMIWQSLQQLPLKEQTTLFIENVGNLVCPSLFDLGEHARVVLMSITEGEDKPLKYPHMFRSADLVLLTKIDLLPYLDYDLPRALQAIQEVQPDAQILQVSARSGEGMEAWYTWVQQQWTSHHQA